MATLLELIKETNQAIVALKERKKIFQGQWAYKSDYKEAQHELAHAEMRLTVLRAFQDACTATRE